MTVFNYTISTFAHNITAKARNGSQSGATRCHTPCFMTLMTTIKTQERKGANRQITKKAAIFVDHSPYCLLFII